MRPSAAVLIHSSAHSVAGGSPGSAALARRSGFARRAAVSPTGAKSPSRSQRVQHVAHTMPLDKMQMFAETRSPKPPLQYIKKRGGLHRRRARPLLAISTRLAYGVRRRSSFPKGEGVGRLLTV